MKVKPGYNRKLIGEFYELGIEHLREKALERFKKGRGEEHAET